MRRYETIKNPLTIVGIFAGLVEVSGASILPFMKESVQQVYVWFLIFFPILLVLLFFAVLWYRHQVLYAPSDYEDQSYFYRIYAHESVSNPIPDYTRPFNLSKQGTDEQKRIAKQSIKFWHPLVTQMSAEEFFVLHSKYYEIGNYIEALICIDIAISKGKSITQAYSYRAATLRRLGRLKEAVQSAEYALSLVPRNMDAHFNLAVCYKNLGQEESAAHHLNEVLSSPDKEEYLELIDQFYGDVEVTT